MFLDKDASHAAKASLVLAYQGPIRLLWLLKRAPELNPMDTRRGHAKEVACANKQYASIDERVPQFAEFLKSLSNEEALGLAGICSPAFWLKNALRLRIAVMPLEYLARYRAPQVRPPGYVVPATNQRGRELPCGGQNPERILQRHHHHTSDRRSRLAVPSGSS